MPVLNFCEISEAHKGAGKQDTFKGGLGFIDVRKIFSENRKATRIYREYMREERVLTQGRAGRVMGLVARKYAINKPDPSFSF